MISRERFRRVFRHEKVHRMPYVYTIGGPRGSTFTAWRHQGLSEEQREKWYEFIGEDEVIGIGTVRFNMIPSFEKKIIEEHDNIRVWIDGEGIKRMDAINQPTSGFQTRRYLGFPVKTPEDFEKIKKRLNPHTLERFIPIEGKDEEETWISYGLFLEKWRTQHWKDRIDICNRSDKPVELIVPGLFWKARDLTGFEGLCIMFHDRPRLVHEVMEYWTSFIMEMLEEPLSSIKIDIVIISEDMAYKTASMVSPTFMREFMLPHYKRLYNFFKSKRVDCVVMDSDGHVSQILKIFYPIAIDGIFPLEIAANNDPERYLKKYPQLFIWGGIDKRELRFSRRRLRAEVVRRYIVAREYGGYIPTVDHAVPPDIPLRNFLYMVELIKGFANGEDIDTYEPPCSLEKKLGENEEIFDPLKAIRSAHGKD